MKDDPKVRTVIALCLWAFALGELIGYGKHWALLNSLIIIGVCSWFVYQIGRRVIRWRQRRQEVHNESR